MNATATILGKQPTDGAGLPEPARARLEALRSQRDDARALLDSSAARVEELRGDLLRARNELSALHNADRRGRLVRQSRQHDDAGFETITTVRDDPRLAAAQQRVDRLAAQLETAEKQQADRRERWQTLGRLVGRVEEWLATQSRPPGLFRGEAPKPAKEPAAELTKTRDLLQALSDERRAVERAPCTVEEAKAKVRPFVEGRAARLRVSGLTSRGAPIAFPQEGLNGPGVSPIDLACWLDPERMARALEREIEARAELGGTPLSEIDQLRRLRDLDEKRLAAERREEALVQQATAAGLDVLRRADADPRAVLGVE